MNGLDTLNDISYEDIQFKIHKLNGELKIHIRHDDEGDRHGLFVHGFRPGSLAEGILQVGDELLEVNGVDVKSKNLEDFLNIIREIEHDSISFKVRRNKLENLNSNIEELKLSKLDSKEFLFSDLSGKGDVGNELSFFYDKLENKSSLISNLDNFNSSILLVSDQIDENFLINPNIDVNKSENSSIFLLTNSYEDSISPKSMNEIVYKHSNVDITLSATESPTLFDDTKNGDDINTSFFKIIIYISLPPSNLETIDNKIGDNNTFNLFNKFDDYSKLLEEESQKDTSKPLGLYIQIFIEN